jgi:malate synthase
VTSRIQIGSLAVDERLHQFVEHEALPGSGVAAATFWEGAEDLIREFSARNRALLDRRDELQRLIDEYHRSAQGSPDPKAYADFLFDIGYLEEIPAPFQIATTDVDPEIAALAAPQLVVPLLNARFATNAANARWGSLYDALYGTDVIDGNNGRSRSATYNPTRGAAVVARARAFLDEHLPLHAVSHADVTSYAVDRGGLVAFVDDVPRRLVDASSFVGYQGDVDTPTALLLVHHGLHVEIQIDRQDPIGSADPAGVKDVVLESALSCIMDLEDSVAAVDVEDKVLGYRNWLRLMQGSLAERVTKEGRTFTRTLNPDRVYQTAGGATLTLPGRAVLYVRQVGPLMTTDAVLDQDGQPTPEWLLDALVCGLAGVHDLRRTGSLQNSAAGSMYVVKPKLHGPAEVAFTVEVFDRVEEILGLRRNTIKIGLMDEERRTSLNLAACIAAARDRVVFINTGFLDRTGDELRTSSLAGPMVRKGDMKQELWLSAYETHNVDVGLACGFAGRAQIGKGMWAAPDNMLEMVEQKIAHPRAGANCAWVPSPTAATLHALHYHQVDVADRQRTLTLRPPTDRLDLLSIPLGAPTEWGNDDVQRELDNNLQSILGYVVRWINDGVGCSKVPDLQSIPLMEDRATCRISSQHIVNWLHHGVVTRVQVEEALRRMAVVVDQQNANDADYRPMAPSCDGEAFQAAMKLVFEGLRQPNGYTEPVLHEHRRRVKAGLVAGIR